MRTKQEWLRQQWNSGSRLKDSVRRLASKDISKQEVVNFFRQTARAIGYSSSLPTPLPKSRKPTRDEVIRKNSAYIGGMFGSTYADWKGTSINAELRSYGYAELES